jgi:hypothetical protein
MPVEALDTHSLFIAMKLERSVTQSGIEVRNYVNASLAIANAKRILFRRLASARPASAAIAQPRTRR